LARLKELAASYGLLLIEDAAQALGSRQNGHCLGTFGDAGVYSLGTTKIITTGQGGVVVTHSQHNYEAFVRNLLHLHAERQNEFADARARTLAPTSLQFHALHVKAHQLAVFFVHVWNVGLRVVVVIAMDGLAPVVEADTAKAAVFKHRF
jgi:dTDP-4-amino-4,6-dideoxygalactose transaminase